MKKFLTLSLTLVVTLLVSSCNSTTKATSAVTISDETTISTETTTETVVETTVESTLNYYKIDSTESTTETKEPAAKKKTTTPKSTTTETATTTTVDNNRKVTGDGQRLGFLKGSTVCGAAVEINGKTFINCIIKDAPMDGVVISGVIWPWDSEITGLTLVSNDEILAPVSTPPTETTTAPTIPSETTTVPTETTIIVEKVRTPTGSGQSLAFEVGDTIVGWSITVNGTTYEGGVVLYNSPYSGTVVDGVVNPWTSEITNQTVITP